ncbi:putative ABC transporter ATP-binding protein YbhF [mine drainage metagenome]|uniref:Putative ABC transporter ATP-binding protein YbhF n=1 Tax=mine drainage metagenome TaxID=410659 RepID=A0A1J5PYH9_9ZZZZ
MNAAVESAVVARGLSKRFGAFTAVDRLDLSIARGEVMGFIGPNGAGKSTTIRMFCGLLTPSAGSATVSGFDVGSQSQAVREHIGYMSQKFSLYGDLTVRENLRFFGGIYRVPQHAMDERMAFAMSMAGLEGRDDALVATLAGGWKQRLALGCAILHRPPVLFLDEPTSGVEPEARRKFWDLIHQLAGDGVTILVSTHYMDEADRLCDRIAIVDHGELVALDTPANLKRSVPGNNVIEVQFHAPPEELPGRLRALPGVTSVQDEGAGMFRVLTTDGSTTTTALVEAAVRAEIGITSLSVQNTTLDDVFVHYTGRQLRDEQVKAPAFVMPPRPGMQP